MTAGLIIAADTFPDNVAIDSRSIIISFMDWLWLFIPIIIIALFAFGFTRRGQELAISRQYGPVVQSYGVLSVNKLRFGEQTIKLYRCRTPEGEKFVLIKVMRTIGSIQTYDIALDDVALDQMMTIRSGDPLKKS